MAEIQEMAVTLGQSLGRTREYQAMDDAIKAADNDREMVTLKNEIQALDQELQGLVRGGDQPPEDKIKEYGEAMEKLQALAAYQLFVAAQSNFEKLMTQVNAGIQQGMKEAAGSRIIISS